MRAQLLIAAALLAACSQQAPAPQTPAEPPALEAACNALTPDPARAVQLQEKGVAAASLTPELRGGPITPGLYDLIGGYVEAGAPAWAQASAVVIEVRENENGVVINAAEARQGGSGIERWSAVFREGPPAQLLFTCGREGETAIAFGVTPEGVLELNAPDPSGTGAQFLQFARRV